MTCMCYSGFVSLINHVILEKDISVWLSQSVGLLQLSGSVPENDATCWMSGVSEAVVSALHELQMTQDPGKLNVVLSNCISFSSVFLSFLPFSHA